MSRGSDAIRLRHMLDAANKAIEFIHGKTREDLDSDEKLAFSLVHLLEILGEAASKVSEETRRANPGIPWVQIVGMRNRLIHAYFEINHEEVWKTLIEDIPVLVPALLKALD